MKRIACWVALSSSLLACGKTAPPEPDPAARAAPTEAASAVARVPAQAGRGTPDPLGGQYSLADVAKDLPGKGPLVARIETSKGALQCKLLDAKAPVSVANFVGLATGKRPWRDPVTGEWVRKPAYDGTTFHRIIKGFMIQGGDAQGNGTGEPGYVIKDEIWEGAKHDRAGLLCMANRGPNTNGAQFFITDASTPHLDGGYTIFGECAPVDVVHTIANVAVDGERPSEKVVIKHVTIERERAH